MHSNNLAARAARWSAAHWKTAVFGWLVLVAAAVVLGNAVGTHKLADSEAGDGQSGKAQHILASAGFKQPSSEQVVISSRTLQTHDGAYVWEIRKVVATLQTFPQVTNVRSPLEPDSTGVISPDGRAALVRFDIKGKAEDAHKHVKPILDSVAKLQQQAPSFTIGEIGDASANYELDKTLGKDFQKAETLAIPITLLIMLLAFGAFVAAGLPVLLAFYKVSCPTCQYVFPFLERIYRGRTDGDIGMYAISQDDAESTREFDREFGITLPTLLDREEDGYPASNAYGLSHVPSMFLIEPDGTIAWSLVGFHKKELEALGTKLGVSPFRDGEQVPEMKSG